MSGNRIIYDFIEEVQKIKESRASKGFDGVLEVGEAIRRLMR